MTHPDALTRRAPTNMEREMRLPPNAQHQYDEMARDYQQAGDARWLALWAAFEQHRHGCGTRDQNRMSVCVALGYDTDVAVDLYDEMVSLAMAGDRVDGGERSVDTFLSAHWAVAGV